MPHRDYPETFDLSIADMDVGFLKEYFKYFVKDMEDKNNFTYKSQY